MATLTKVVSGNLYTEEFDMLNYMWEVTPNIAGRVVLSDGILTLKHGDERVSMLTNTPSGDFVFQANIKHEPSTLSDIAGIVIMADNNNMIECQTYYNTTMSLNQYYISMKVTKVGDVYTFTATRDGVQWETIGASQLLDAHKIGFFIDGVPSAMSKDFQVYNASFYKANYLTFMNVSSGMRIDILDSHAKLVLSHIVDTTDNKDFIDCNTTIFPILGATIKIYQNDTNVLLYNEPNVDIAGGDIFDYLVKIKITINGIEIDPATPYDLGHIGIGGDEFLLSVINTDNTVLVGRTLSVIEYSNFYRGGKFAHLALENTDGSVGTYTQKLSLPNILPNSFLNVWMNIERDLSGEAPFYAKQYKYKVVIE